MKNNFYLNYLSVLLLFFALFAGTVSRAQIITTIAGTGVYGSTGDGGPATSAGLDYAYGVAADGFGNVYISGYDQRIRKVNSSGIISTFAGTGTTGYSGDGGAATAAELSDPWGIAVDASGNVYIGDFGNSRVRKVNTSGIISTFAGNGSPGFSGDGAAATAAELFAPYGLTVDASGNVYICDWDNFRIRKVSSSGIISTLAGNGTFGYTGDGGPATAAEVGFLFGMTVDGSGNVYFADIDHWVVRVVNSSGIIGTFAGTGTTGFFGDGGPATAAKLGNPYGIAADTYGNIYIGDEGNTCVRRVNPSGIINTIAGTGDWGFSGDGGPATACHFSGPTGIAVDGDQSLYVADWANARIRKIVNNHTHAPHFANGHRQTMTICADTLAIPINSQLAILDSDIGRTETWTTLLAPAHGTLSLPHTGISTGGVLTPTGITYRPSGGSYSGLDSFRVRVSDGTASDTTTVVLTINPSPAPIAGTTAICLESTTALTDVSLGGLWSSSNILIATIGTGSGIVTGVGRGTAIITYSFTSGCRATVLVTVNPAPAAITGTTVICTGLVTTLTDATSGGTWSSGNTLVATIGSSSGMATGLSSGTATISYMVGACKVSATITVNSVGPILGSLNTCAGGGSTTLADISTGGTWSSGDYAVASVGSGTGVVTGILAGTTNITYTLPSRCQAMITVTVNPLPAPISGVTEICTGYTTTLSDVSTGGIWTSGNLAMALAGTGTGIITGMALGMAIIRYTLPTGCRDSVEVTVYPNPPAITGTTTLCVGAATSLGDSYGGGIWSSSNSAVAPVIATLGLVSGLSAGTATISYVVSTGCFRTIPVTVTPAPPAIAGSASLCPGTTTLLTDGAGGGTWSSSTTTIATIGSSTGIVTALSTGTARITYSLGGSCRVTLVETVITLPAVITGTVTVCPGATTTLHDVTIGGTWSSRNIAIATAGSSTGIVTGVSTGTVIITYKTGSGCITTTTITVRPNPLAITGVATLCAGGSFTVIDGTTGGAWSSSRTLIATIGSGTGVVSGISAGTTIMTYRLTTGCISTATVTVSGPPPAITGASSVCAGATILLTDGTGGGSWSSSSGAIAAIGTGSGVVTGVSPGTARITYSVGMGCLITKTVSVLPDPLPIRGAAYICVGMSTTLTDATIGGTWSDSRTAIASVGSVTGMVTGIAPGTTIVTYTTASGCVTTATETVVSAPGPIIGLSSVLIGGTITLTDALGGGTWSSSRLAVATVGSSTGIVSGASLGTSMITYSLGSGCIVTKAITVSGGLRGAAANQGMDTASAGPGIFHNRSLEIFPDPSNGSFSVVLNSDKEEELQISITNSAGQKVEDYISLTNSQLKINLKAPAGIYVVYAICGHHVYSKKVVITR